MPRASLTDHRTILFPNGTERDISSEVVLFSSNDDEYFVRINTADGWILVGGAPTGTLMSVDQHWYASVRADPSFRLDSSRTMLTLPEGSVEFERPLWRLVQSRAHEKIFVVLFTMRKDDPQNIRGFNAQGKELWRIPKPIAPRISNGYYHVGNWKDGTMYVKNLAGFAHHIDPVTGDIIRTVETR